MERSLLRYTWMHTKPLQIWLAVVILVSMPVYFYSLDIPKRIINGPVQGHGFEDGAQTILQITLPFYRDPAGQPLVLFDGIDAGRIPVLIFLCVIFTVLTVLNGWFKLYINTYKGKTGERVLRRLRYEMVDRVLRFPIWRARQLKPSEISGVVKEEIEPLSEFIGDAFSAPLFLAGQALTGFIFLMVQNVYFGFLTAGVIAFQMWIIPRLRRRLLVLGRERQMTAREMAGRIDEIVQGIDDIHLNDTSNLSRSDLTNRLSTIFFIRLELFKRKFTVKFLNNLLMSLLAIAFYLIGGYFVITGRMDIGALVASIAAYKDLPGPVKGLIDWDQQRLMAQVRYGHAIEGFARDDLIAERLQQDDGKARRITNAIETRGIYVQPEGASPLVEDVSVRIEPHERVAVLSDPPDGGVALLEVFAHLVDPTRGRVTIDGEEAKGLAESFIGRSIGYVDGNSFLASGSIHASMVEVLKNRPVGPASEIPGTRASIAMRDLESRMTGNSQHEFLAPWIDGERIGAATDELLFARIREAARLAGLETDIRDMGLTNRASAETVERIAARIAEARRKLRERLEEAGLAGFVEQFDPDRYSVQSTVAENILFGMAVDPSFAPAELARNPLFTALLDKSDLKDTLVSLGLEIARTFTEMFSDLAADSQLFESAAGMTPERISRLGEIVLQVDASGIGAADKAAITELTSLAMDYAEPRFRFGLVTADMREQVLGMRHRLRSELEGRAGAAVVFHDFEIYNPSLSIADNVLFGRIDTNLVGGRARVNAAVAEILSDLGLADTVFAAGLAFNIGAGGRALSEPQRQKLRLARAILKAPDVLILNRALGALAAAEQRTILDGLLALPPSASGRRLGIICAPVNAEHADLFDRVVVLKHGRLVEDRATPHLSEAAAE